ncbi:hypothetical protein D3C87_1650120 [compost metagenome]
MTDAALERVGKTTRVQHHAAQPRWLQASHRQLRVGRVRQTHAANPAVAPGLLDDPGERVEAVLAFSGVLGEYPFGGVTPATVLEDRYKPLLGEPCRHRLAGNVLPVELLLRTRRFAFVVRRAFDHDRKRTFNVCRQIDVGGQVHAIAHGDRLVAQNLHGRYRLFRKEVHIKTLLTRAPAASPQVPSGGQ